MGYFSEESYENYDRENIKQNNQKTTTSKQNNSLTKEELINTIMKEDPRRDRRVLESFSEFYLKNTLKQILKTQKRGLETTKKGSYVNPFEIYDRMQDERQGRFF